MKKLLLLLAFLLSFASNAAVTINALSVTNTSVTSAKLSFYTAPGCTNGAMITYEYSANPAFTPATTTSATYMSYAAGTKVVDLTGLQSGFTYYWRVSGSNSCTTTTTTVNGYAFTTLLVDKPAVTSILSTPSYNYATINYSINANGQTTTSVIKYGLSSASLTNTAYGFSATGTAVTGGNGTISSLSPNTQYYYQIVATNSAGITSSAINSFTTTSQTPTIATSGVSPSSATASTINYSINANGLATTSVINYGTSSGALTNQISSGSASGGVDTALSAILSGLNTGTTYFYQIVATNSAGSTSSSILDFIQGNPATTAIAEYNFDNSATNIYGNTPFTPTSGTLNYTFDRNGNTGRALILSNGSTTQATIANLPLGNTARTVSIWVKQPVQSGDSHIFRYGALAPNSCYGLSNQSANLVHFGYSNDITVAGQAATGSNWVHIVTTFDGITAKVYRNGTMIISANKSGWNTTATNFVLGSGTAEVYIDDLKIYGRAITATEVTSLYTNNTLSASDFNTNTLKASIYPNPAKDVLNISIENEIKQVEIYNLQGQKVLTSSLKNVNIAGLCKGIYLVRIEDDNNAVATQKLVIE